MGTVMRFIATQFAAVAEFFRLLTRHRQLAWELGRRDLGERYAGQMLGTWWIVGHPLALMLVYLVVFAYVFRIKLGGTADMPRDYATYLLAGLIPWLAFQDALSRSTSAVTSQAGLVKQVAFPVELLPVKGIASALATQGAATVLLLIYTVLHDGAPPATWLLLPGLWLLQACAMVGCAYLLAATGVWVRDLKDVVQVFCTANLYLMPILYLPDWVPEIVRPLLWFNPFSAVVWCYQDACYFGRIAHPGAWFGFAAISLLALALGFQWFRRLKTLFGNAL